MSTENKQIVYAKTNHEILTKTLSVSAFDQLNVVVPDIYCALENQEERTNCHRYRFI